MSQRFFISTPIHGSHAVLTGAEAHHLAHVMRAQPGETVTLFDGSGCEFSARIESVSKSRVELTVVERREAERESSVEITLAVALPKGDRQRWLIEKAVELGVAKLTPLVTERGVAQPTDSAIARLERAAIEAAKQCGRNRLLSISPAAQWDEYVVSVADGAVRWIAHPGGVPLSQAWSAAKTKSGVIVAIGPEGAFPTTKCNMALPQDGS